ncbi:MAG: hypothetical protein ABI813_14545 [Bacteroidota bacterium]
MKQKCTIQQLLAGVLLLVLALSITPKKFLHDAIANHKDKAAVLVRGNETQLSHSGFICKCDNLVAESPFTNAAVHFEFAAIRCFSFQKQILLYHFYSVTFFFFERRGPPAINTELV